MTEIENSKDLISVLWSGADILRSKMDANEYKDYLLGIVFYKYLSDSFLIKVYDLLYDEKPSTLKDAVEAYKEALNDEESSEELKKQLAEECHYVMEPELTYTHFARKQEIILLTGSSCKKASITLSRVILFLLICLLILIYIPIDWVQEIRNRAIQLPVL